MIHLENGKQSSQLYDRDGQVWSQIGLHKIWLTRKYDLQCINSIDRALLNEGLLEEVLARPEITVYFEHKCIAADFDSKVLTFCSVSPTNGEADVKVNFDFCIGADGSYSVVRRQLMRYVR